LAPAPHARRAFGETHVRVRIRVPASTSNLGPGFDCLGLALDLPFVVELQTDAASPGVFFVGTRPPSDNLFRAALRRGGGVPARTRLEVQSHIPLARGLGSSGAAIVAGLLAARFAAGDAAPRLDAVLDAALALEGHPDNLAASVHGGLVASVADGDTVRAMRLPLDPAWSLVLVIPDRGVETAPARALLPDAVPRADAVHNLQRLAFLIGALQAGAADRLRYGLADRLHQDLRLGLVPGLRDALAALATEPGCAGAALSGSGPTLVGFVYGDVAVSGAGAVAALARHGVGATVVRTRPAGGATWDLAGST
jgi:homoserine kinase